MFGEFRGSSKKTFETHWVKHLVVPNSPLTYPERKFYDFVSPERVEIIQPDEIRFVDLKPFVGKRTRVTIEILPD